MDARPALPRRPEPGRPPPGVVILGGAHGALALARDIGRLGVPVWHVTNDHPLPRLSRYVTRAWWWAGPKSADAVGWLLALAAEHGLDDWKLVAAGDAEVRLVASHLADLAGPFRIDLPDWRSLNALCDKSLLYRHAERLGLDAPKTYDAVGAAAVAALDCRFPVVLKPSMRVAANRFTRAKAWRADDKAMLLRLHAEAARLVGDEGVVIQDLIPGGGACQLSYAAYWADGMPVGELTARRTRQYPVDFGYTSTLVETIEDPALIAASRRLLAGIGFAGLVEVEYKRDARDGRLAVLDVNPRPWSWLGLGAAAGVDFGALCLGVGPCGSAARPARWMNLSRDSVAAIQTMLRGGLSLPAYLASFRSPLVWASYAADDPLPGLAETPLVAFRLLRGRLPALLGIGRR